MEEGESSSNLYKGLGIAKDLTFFRMNPKGFEHCYIGDERFDIPAGAENFKNALTQRFPKEKKGIERYLQSVQKVSKELQLIPKIDGFIDAITIPWRTRHLGKYGLFSLKKVLQWHIKDSLLSTIVNTQTGDHGLPPKQVPFALHAAVMEHYLSGGYYPMGGGSSIVNAMIKKIENFGSEVRVKSKVKRIIIEKDGEKYLAKGVELESGEKLYAKQIVSNADPAVTYEELVTRNYLTPKMIKQLDKTIYSCSSLILFLRVEMDLKALGLDSGNIWIIPHKDMDETYQEMMDENLDTNEEFNGMFISCTTLKDPTSFDGKHHTLEVVTFINRDAFKKYNNEDKKRSAEYKAFKARLMQKMIQKLSTVIPSIQEHIIYKELATPLTNEDFINATRGSVYGTQKSLYQIGPNAYKPKSEIKNLYLCGASILAHGITGATFSGVDTAANILGTTQDELLKIEGDQKLKIYDADDNSNYPQWLQNQIKTKKGEKNV
jgi:phytoene dehydrogenase-like protein